MKKVLLILAVAGFAVACNNSSESKEGENKDTTTVTEPTTPTIDSTATTPTDSTATMPATDSTAK
ncbi:MAG TPA: hypothetical protein PKC72_14510 [Chitinophagaceae bacterium]|nr:hypothetical protein [Chitinophagaceae bacterium]